MVGKSVLAPAIAIVVVLLLVAPVSARGVAPIVYYYGNNTADGFVKSLKPMKLIGDGYGILQSGSGKGAVVMSDYANEVDHETSAGFVVYISWTTLSHLVSIRVAPSDLVLTGSTRFALNLWIDANPSDDAGNGPFFEWTGNTFTDLGGDVYALGPGVGAGEGGVLTVDLATTFFVIGGGLNGQSVSLSTLETAYPDAMAGIWIGLDIPGGTVGTGYVVISPVSSPEKLKIVTA